MTNEEYVHLQKMWLEATGVKKGDWVKVMRAAEDHESGWSNSWTPGMDAVVGTFVQVLGSWDPNGIEVASGKFSPPSYRLPFFILDPTRKPKPEKYTFTPFEQVLTRNYNSDNWTASLFSYIGDGFFACTDAFWAQCIPYAGHEHLLGTKDEPEDWAKYYDKE
ncbi:hypothetical protein [Pyramidobacter sp.]|uniref:hypothetical protein n=1 Tax=Pyramidobacter sp. TaxID=1943581 RepID=UPI00332FD686